MKETFKANFQRNAIKIHSALNLTKTITYSIDAHRRRGEWYKTPQKYLLKYV